MVRVLACIRIRVRVLNHVRVRIKPTVNFQSSAFSYFTFQYESPSYKSDTLRVKAVLVNPTKYWVYPRLKKWNYKNKKVEINPTEFSGNDNSNSSPDKFKYRTVPSPYSVETNDAEFDQGNNNNLVPPINFSRLGLNSTLGIFSIEMVLFKEGSDDIYDRELEDEVARCSTPFIWRNGKGQGSTDFLRERIL